MNIVVAIDSFKGSLSSMEAGRAVKEGIQNVFPKADVSISPVADGGEGTVESLVKGLDGELQNRIVSGPLGKPVLASYGILPGEKTAILEMAQASGLTLLKEEERNPLVTTTYGVGELIKDAILKGCRKFIVGIGGSATNDGGTGMLKALGFAFLDQDGKEIKEGAKGLSSLAQIHGESVIKELKECKFQIACDVKNPLCGANGCSHIFGPQKGADKEMAEKMDIWMEHYAKTAKEFSKKADPSCPGAGAAGGLGFAFLTFTDAVLQSGIQIILEETKLEEKIKKADLVITGEGRLDAQTVMGKAPEGIAKIAKKYNKPVLAFAGCVSKDAAVCNENGIDAYFPILQNIVTKEEAMEKETAYQNLKETAEQVMRVWKLRG